MQNKNNLTSRASSLFLVTFIIAAFIFTSIDISLFLPGSITRDVFCKFKYARNITVYDIQNLIPKDNATKKDISLAFKILLEQRLINSLLTQYDIECSTQYVKNMLQEESNKNSQIITTKSFKKQECKQLVNQRIFQTIFSPILNSTVAVPNLLTKQLSKFMLQHKQIDLIEVDLSKQKFSLSYASDKELEEFLLKNQKQFLVPEKRDVLYINVALTNGKQQINKLSKSLDELKNGKCTIEKIAADYKSKINIFKGKKTQAQHKFNYSEVSDKIFHTAEGDTYLYNKGNNTYTIFYIKKTYKEYLPSLQSIKNDVKREYDKCSTILQNKTALYLFFRKNLTKIEQSKNIAGLLKKYNMTNCKVLHCNLSQTNATKYSHLPSRLVEDIIYHAEKGRSTPIFLQENKAFFAIVREVKQEQCNFELEQKIKNALNASIGQSIIAELIDHLKQKEQIQINKEYVSFIGKGVL